MSVSAVSTNAVARAYSTGATPPPAPPVKDNDGDGDDGASRAKAATPPGVGENVDLKV